MRRGPIPTFSADPKVAADERMREAAEIVREALVAEGANHAIVAAHLGVSERELGRCVSTSSGRHMPLGHVLGLPEPVLERVANRMVESIGCAVVRMPKPSETMTDFATFASVARESSDVVACGLESLADGRMDSAEGARLERECDELLAVVLRAREIARMAQREGVIGLTRRMDS